MAIPLEPQKQCVEQCEPLGIRVTDDVARKVDEVARHWKSRCGGLIGVRPEQVRLTALNLPYDGARRHTRLREVTRGVAPAVEIFRHAERHAVGVDHWAFA